MAKVTERYDNEAERQSIIASYNAQGYWVLHDDYDPDWVPGTEPHGTLTFTDTERPKTPEELAEEAALVKQAELHNHLSSGWYVVLCKPPNGAKRVTNVFVTVDGKLEVEYEI